MSLRVSPVRPPAAVVAAPAPPSPWRAAADKGFTMLLAVVQTVLIGWFGFQLTGRLDLALKDRQATVAAVGAMGKLVEQMQDPQSDAAYRTLVRKIAMYGVDAVAPLTIMAAATGPYSEEVPLLGLKLVSVHHRRETCAALNGAIAAHIDKVRVLSIQKLAKELAC